MRRWQILTLMTTFSVTPTTSTIMPTTKALWSYLRPYSIAALRRINLKTALISQVRMLTLFEVQVLQVTNGAKRVLLARRFRHLMDCSDTAGSNPGWLNQLYTSGWVFSLCRCAAIILLIISMRSVIAMSKYRHFSESSIHSFKRIFLRMLIHRHFASSFR